MRIPIIALAAVSFLSTVGHAQTDVPGRVEAEDYSAFSDSTPGNRGGQYRNDDVDIQVTGDSGGGFNVGWIARGETLSYPIQVQQDGVYEMTLRVASRRRNGSIDVFIDGEKLQDSPVEFRSTGGWQRWRDVSVEIELRRGEKTLTLEFLRPAMNINYVDFEWVDTLEPENPGPVTPPNNPECPSTHFIDTEGRCVRHVSEGRGGFPTIRTFCEYPSTPRYEPSSTGPYNTRLTGCFEPSTPVVENAVSVECPAPYQRDFRGLCHQSSRYQQYACFYPNCD